MRACASSALRSHEQGRWLGHVHRLSPALISLQKAPHAERKGTTHGTKRKETDQVGAGHTSQPESLAPHKAVRPHALKPVVKQVGLADVLDTRRQVAAGAPSKCGVAIVGGPHHCVQVAAACGAAGLLGRACTSGGSACTGTACRCTLLIACPNRHTRRSLPRLPRLPTGTARQSTLACFRLQLPGQ